MNEIVAMIQKSKNEKKKNSKAEMKGKEDEQHILKQKQIDKE